MSAYLSAKEVWVEPSPELEARIVGAIRSEAGKVRQPRRLRYLVAGLAAAAAVLAAGLWGLVGTGGSDHSVRFAGRLSGTVLTPGANGQVSLVQTTSGWQVRLHATGLTRLDDGQFYEAWMKSPADVLVPIGTFNAPQNVTLWSGVAPADYPGITVTRQVAGSGENSSGRVVLEGTTHRS